MKLTSYTTKVYYWGKEEEGKMKVGERKEAEAEAEAWVVKPWL